MDKEEPDLLYRPLLQPLQWTTVSTRQGDRDSLFRSITRKRKKRYHSTDRESPLFPYPATKREGHSTDRRTDSHSLACPPPLPRPPLTSRRPTARPSEFRGKGPTFWMDGRVRWMDGCTATPSFHSQPSQPSDCVATQLCCYASGFPHSINNQSIQSLTLDLGRQEID